MLILSNTRGKRGKKANPNRKVVEYKKPLTPTTSDRISRVIFPFLQWFMLVWGRAEKRKRKTTRQINSARHMICSEWIT
jgi:hypothetical protein